MWDDKWNKKALETHRLRVGPIAFDRGLRNIALSNKDRAFPSFEKCIKNVDKKLLLEEKYKVFSGVDLSTKKRAGTCIFTLAKTTKTRKYIPLDIRVGKWTGPKLLENIINVQKLFNCHSFLVENNALQDMVIDLLKEYIKNRKIERKPFIKGKFTGSNKLELEHGLESLEVEFYNNQWIIPEKDIMHKLNCRCGFCRWKDEVIGYPFFSTDDVLMASWFARENARKSSIGRIRLL